MTLTDNAIRAIARNLMPQFLTKGMSSRAITSYLKSEFGPAYRRTVLLADMREFAGLAKYQRQTEQYSNTQKFSTALMDERELRRERKYMVKGKVVYRDMDTGEESEVWGTMYSDKYGSKDEWSDEYLDYQVESESDPTKVVMGFKVTNIVHYKGRPY